MNCACESDDPYDCWGIRYYGHRMTSATIDHDGGPCQCACHSEWWALSDDDDVPENIP
jgi:hypothetical protein